MEIGKGFYFWPVVARERKTLLHLASICGTDTKRVLLFTRCHVGEDFYFWMPVRGKVGGKCQQVLHVDVILDCYLRFGFIYV